MARELVNSSIGVDLDAFTKSPSMSSYSIFMLLLIFPPTSSFHSWATIAFSSAMLLVQNFAPWGPVARGETRLYSACAR